MELSKEEKEHIISELTIELHAKLDGSGKNLVVPVCPYDALPVDEVDFIDPRLAGKDPRKGRMYGPGDPGIGIGLAKGVEGGERVDNVS